MSHPWEEMRLIDAIGPVDMGTARNGTYISLKNTNRAYIVVHFGLQSTGVMTVTPYQATAIAGTGAKVFSNVLPIWASNGCSSDETLTKQTASTQFSFNTSTGDKMVIFEVQPGQMDLANSFDCIQVRLSATCSSDSASAFYYADMRYQCADTPTVFEN